MCSPLPNSTPNLYSEWKKTVCDADFNDCLRLSIANGTFSSARMEAMTAACGMFGV
jgi:hypothetical protein